jgi:hypothetical protein
MLRSTRIPPQTNLRADPTVVARRGRAYPQIYQRAPNCLAKHSSAMVAIAAKCLNFLNTMNDGLNGE